MTRRLISEFYLNKSLKDLEREFCVDQRKIRKLWRDEFGIEEVNKRKYRIREIYIKAKCGLSAHQISEIYRLLGLGYTTIKVAKMLKISRSVVQKYLSFNNELLGAVKERNRSAASGIMKHLRKNVIKKQNSTISDSTKTEVLHYFDTDMFLNEIAIKVNLCVSSVENIFQKHMGKAECSKRAERLEPKRKRKSLQALERAGKLGSKPERLFYKYLNGCLNTKVIHHDFEIMPPFEIDITLPEIKVAICWDGVGHFKPIFGENIFKQVVYRDKQKRKYLESIGWECYTITDLKSRWKNKEMIGQVYEFVGFLNKIGYGDIFNEKQLQESS